ncbi:MAG: ImmA/IrrE family metallo-endopeptidase [Staphylococcus equorum]|nr:ImmA/IrrE family metallo-endopeptidase [Staphylococcus equorum]
MKQCLIDNNFNIYNDLDVPEKLARKTHLRYFGREVSENDLPIDPFKVLKDSGAIYGIMDFDKLEGFYLLPEQDTSEPAFIGINKNRPVARQRFTAAHELCHHLKDNDTIVCEFGDSTPIEVFANKFSSEFLMPTVILKDMLEARDVTEGELDKILELSIQFGMSFHATLIKVSNVLGWGHSSKEVKRLAAKYKPSKKREEKGLDNDISLYKQVLDSYQFIKIKPPKKIKTDFLRYVITNDHRMENGSLSEERISEILALIRINGVNSVRKSLNENETEVIGQYRMYEKIFEEIPVKKSYTSFLGLHRKLYECAPFPEVGGCFREVTARINGTSVKTTNPKKIGLEVYSVGEQSDYYIYHSFENYISVVVRAFCQLHHNLTVIHPFQDGNGRVARAFLNQQLLSISVPPIFILEKEKRDYRIGLEELDFSAEVNCDKLFEFIIRKIINNYSIFIPSIEENDDN